MSFFGVKMCPLKVFTTSLRMMGLIKSTKSKSDYKYMLFVQISQKNNIDNLSMAA